jgi:hypothetical protein
MLDQLPGEKLLKKPLLTSWSRVLLEKLSVTQLVKKFPTLFGTLTVFARGCHWFDLS